MQDDLYLPLNSDAFSSASDWETVSEVNLPDVMPLKEISIPVVPWRLIPVDVPPQGPFQGGRRI